MWLRSTVSADADTGSSRCDLVGELGGSSRRSRGGRGLVGRLYDGLAGTDGDGTTGDGLDAKILDVRGDTTAPNDDDALAGGGDNERPLLVLLPDRKSVV